MPYLNNANLTFKKNQNCFLYSLIYRNPFIEYCFLGDDCLWRIAGWGIAETVFLYIQALFPIMVDKLDLFGSHTTRPDEA